MIFKQPHMEAQYNALPEKLKDICNTFCTLSEDHLVTPVVTRVSDPVQGESGVHPLHRAVDFRNQKFDGKNNVWLYSQETVDEIVKAINEQYPRKDGKPTCLHHSFQGGAFHFHLQVQFSDLTEDEKERLYGNGDH